MNYTPERLGNLVEVAPNGCWIWQRSLDRDGYGKRRRDEQSQYAHRYSYELYVGPITKGLELDHIGSERASTPST